MVARLLAREIELFIIRESSLSQLRMLIIHALVIIRRSCDIQVIPNGTMSTFFKSLLSKRLTILFSSIHQSRVKLAASSIENLFSCLIVRNPLVHPLMVDSPQANLSRRELSAKRTPLEVLRNPYGSTDRHSLKRKRRNRTH